jgi:hypothetical protein
MSQELIENIEDTAICSIYIDKSIPCVTIVWKGYVTSPQLRSVHESLLNVIRMHKLRKILGDDSALPTVHEDDQRWIAKDWVPRAIAAGLRVGAAKSAASHFGRVSLGNLRTAVSAAMPIRCFDDLETARQWLKNFTITA